MLMGGCTEVYKGEYEGGWKDGWIHGQGKYL